jgi:hypothetical protein
MGVLLHLGVLKFYRRALIRFLLTPIPGIPKLRMLEMSISRNVVPEKFGHSPWYKLRPDSGGFPKLHVVVLCLKLIVL